MTKRIGRKHLSLWVLAASLGAGCTSVELISSGRSDLRVEGVANPAVPLPPYDFAMMTISDLIVRPTDPVADQALGARSIGILLFPKRMSLKSTTGTLFDQVVLSAGSYRGIEVGLKNLDLNEDPSDPAAPGGSGTRCQSGVLRSVAADVQVNVGFEATDVFVVPGGAPSVVELRVDGEKLVALIQSHCVGDTFTFPTADEFKTAGVFSLR